MSNVNRSTTLLIKLALLAAFALVLTYFYFPILPAFPWLRIDLSDIPPLIGAFAFGPMAGIIIELVKNILVFFVNSSGTGGIGELANFIIGASFVGCAGLIYLRSKTRKNAVIAMVISTIVMSVIGVLANYFILMPLYGMDKMPGRDLINYIIAGVIPFNLIKGVMVSVVTIVIYKRIAVLIRGAEMTTKKDEVKKIA